MGNEKGTRMRMFHRMLKAGALVLVVGFVGLAVFQVAFSSQGAEGTDAAAPVVLGQVPEGMKPAAVLILPEDHPNTEMLYSIVLYRIVAPELTQRLGVGGDGFTPVVAIFTRPVAESAATESVIDRLGPRGLHGLLIVDAGIEHLFASRDLELDQIRNFAGLVSEAREAGWLLQLAEQRVSSVPGIGSLQLPPDTLGYAISYIVDARPGFTQRSVAVGRHQGQLSDLEILAWWLDGELVVDSQDELTTMVAMLPAVTAVGVQNIPDASFVAQYQDGVVSIVRTVEAGSDPLSLLNTLREASSDEWRELSTMRPSQ